MATAYNSATGQVVNTAASAPQTTTEDTTKKKKTATETMNQIGAETQAGINSAYDTSLSAQKQALLNAYNANTAAQTQQGQTVQQQAEWMNKDLAVQNARNTANINQFADVRNLNRQQGSQAALSLGAAGAKAANTLAYQQQQALAENKRQQDLMKTQYQADVAAAIADNDYKRAAALLDDYNNQNTWKEKQAEILASYGNFDPYGELYGADAAASMKNVWAAQNPEVAYRTGAIDAETYKNITGSYPAGYTPPSYYGDFGWYTGAGGEDEEGRKPADAYFGKYRPAGPNIASISSASRTSQANAAAASPASAITAYGNNLATAASFGVP